MKPNNNPTGYNGVNSTWDDERVEKLTKLWSEGLSASEVGARLGVSRNAVIGKLHRMGLAGRHYGRKMPSRAKPRSQRPKLAYANPNPQRKSSRLFTAEPFVPTPEIEVPLKERRGIAGLQDAQCRWPIGDPQKPDFHFCNGVKEPGLPYCAHHCRVAFKPPEDRKKPVSQHFWVPNHDMTHGLTALDTGEAPIDTREKQDA
jgi:GcrA cell cycle regulator